MDVDLSEDQPPLSFFELLDGTWDWRIRSTEQFRFTSGSHVRVTGAYQMEFTEVVLSRLGVDADRVRRLHLLLPLTTRKKRALLDVVFTGPSGEPQMMSRSDTASFQASYLKKLVATSTSTAVQASQVPPNRRRV